MQAAPDRALSLASQLPQVRVPHGYRCDDHLPLQVPIPYRYRRDDRPPVGATVFFYSVHARPHGLIGGPYGPNRGTGAAPTPVVTSQWCRRSRYCGSGLARDEGGTGITALESEWAQVAQGLILRFLSRQPTTAHREAISISPDRPRQRAHLPARHSVSALARCPGGCPA